MGSASPAVAMGPPLPGSWRRAWRPGASEAEDAAFFFSGIGRTWKVMFRDDRVDVDIDGYIME